MSKIESNEAVIIVLQNPREKIWGVLNEINAAGIYVRGIDLNAFDELMRAIQNNEYFYGLSSLFIPMWRVERISRDEPDGDIPSLVQQFEERTGVNVADL